MNTGAEFGLTPETTIRDSLYDLVPLSAEASNLLATPAMLRLDGIQQLGFVSRIWPGARHSRLEHSIGVMHLMREALAQLASRGMAVDPESARTGIAAALLHDVGHYPFSHAIEELGPPVLPHEKVGRRLSLGAEIADVLSGKWRVDPARVAALIDPPETGFDSRDRIAGQLLSGPLDVDKLEYLPRDARACAVPYGGVDTTRLLGALIDVETPSGQVLGIDHKGISPMHSLMNARQEMFDNVYWHHTNRACMAMLLRGVQDALDAGLQADELSGYADVTLLQRLSSPDMPESTRRLVWGLQQRRFHKRAVEISSRASDLYRYLSSLFAAPSSRRELERSLTSSIGRLAGVEVADGDILIDIPKPEKWRSNVWVQYDNPPVGLRRTMTWSEATGGGDSPLSTYEHHRRLVRIVSTASTRELVRKHWQSVIYPLLGSV
ncbi:HD domain-containing protein [soil metagenome]